jgi:hypothetical protein
LFGVKEPGFYGAIVRSFQSPYSYTSIYLFLIMHVNIIILSC